MFPSPARDPVCLQVTTGFRSLGDDLVLRSPLLPALVLGATFLLGLLKGLHVCQLRDGLNGRRPAIPIKVCLALKFELVHIQASRGFGVGQLAEDLWVERPEPQEFFDDVFRDEGAIRPRPFYTLTF